MGAFKYCKKCCSMQQTTDKGLCPMCRNQIGSEVKYKTLWKYKKSYKTVIHKINLSLEAAQRLVKADQVDNADAKVKMLVYERM